MLERFDWAMSRERRRDRPAILAVAIAAAALAPNLPDINARNFVRWLLPARVHKVELHTERDVRDRDAAAAPAAALPIGFAQQLDHRGAGHPN